DVAMFFFSSRRRHTRWPRDWSSDVCSSDLEWDRQEALCLWFTVDLVTFQRMVSVLPDVERRIKLLEFAAQHATRPGGAESHTLQIGRASCRERVSVAVGVVWFEDTIGVTER